MRHEQHRHLDAFLEQLHLQAHLLAQLDVEVAERFIEQQDVRLGHDRSRKRHALLLPAAQLRSRPIFQTAEPDEFENLGDPFPDLFARMFVCLQRESHVLCDRHVRPDRVRLKHHSDVAFIGRDAELSARVDDRLVAEEHLAAVGLLQPGHDAQGRGLSAPAGAEQRDELTVRDVERDVIDRWRCRAAVRLGDRLDPHRHVASLVHRPSSARCGHARRSLLHDGLVLSCTDVVVRATRRRLGDRRVRHMCPASNSAAAPASEPAARAPATSP